MKYFKLMTIVLTILFAISCSNDSTAPDSFGNVTLKITDAPMHYDQFMKANVTIDKIEIGNSLDPSSFIVLRDTPMKVNLLGLVNGITQTMASLDIPEGDYNMLRLYISTTEMVMKNGNSYSYDMGLHGFSSSGMMQNGMMLNNRNKSIDIPLEHILTVTNGSLHEYLLDIDVENSFMLNGVSFTGTGPNMIMHMNGFTFRPMMRFVNMHNAGMIYGTVYGPSGNLPDATVTILQNGEVYTTTHTNFNGKYALIGIPEGSYTIIVEKSGYILNPVGNESNTGTLNIAAGSKIIVDFSMIIGN
ncbi:MAG: DUF4382 domain-containing protein [Flavobacteriaceae bacterium]|nr:DUF4382 domain-containing protein [Flavobacteriaceae bacterium]